MRISVSVWPCCACALAADDLFELVMHGLQLAEGAHALDNAGAARVNRDRGRGNQGEPKRGHDPGELAQPIQSSLKSGECQEHAR